MPKGCPKDAKDAQRMLQASLRTNTEILLPSWNQRNKRGMTSAYVLYIRTGDVNSDVAVQLVSRDSPVHIQDILDLIDEGIPFPVWLRGVPTLVSTVDGALYQGSSALKKLMHMIPDRAVTVQDVVTRPASSSTPSPAEEVENEFVDEDAIPQQYSAEGDPPIADRADVAFEPLVDGEVEEDDDAKKIDMSDINAELSRRGLGGGGA